jgi:hypothetical protein
MDMCHLNLNAQAMNDDGDDMWFERTVILVMLSLGRKLSTKTMETCLM